MICTGSLELLEPLWVHLSFRTKDFYMTHDAICHVLSHNLKHGKNLASSYWKGFNVNETCFGLHKILNLAKSFPWGQRFWQYVNLLSTHVKNFALGELFVTDSDRSEHKSCNNTTNSFTTVKLQFSSWHRNIFRWAIGRKIKWFYLHLMKQTSPGRVKPITIAFNSLLKSLPWLIQTSLFQLILFVPSRTQNQPRCSNNTSSPIENGFSSKWKPHGFSQKPEIEDVTNPEWSGRWLLLFFLYCNSNFMYYLFPRSLGKRQCSLSSVKMFLIVKVKMKVQFVRTPVLKWTGCSERGFTDKFFSDNPHSLVGIPLILGNFTNQIPHFSSKFNITDWSIHCGTFLPKLGDFSIPLRRIFLGWDSLNIRKFH